MGACFSPPCHIALVPLLLYISILLTPNLPGVQSIIMSEILTKSSVTPETLTPLSSKNAIFDFVDAKTGKPASNAPLIS